ncbi:MAG: LCP family protein [Clostridia bacterium]|nr:LCP family protein [Clostridia bacterium]
MRKRFSCAVMAALCLCAALPLAALAAVKPREIVPLEYDALPAPREGQRHYLLACVDNWRGNPRNLGNTDGVILVTMDTRARRLMFTTFTREMLVQRPDGAIGRINYLAKNYGPEALCRTISTHFGVKVDKYILFDMNNVQTIIEAMGGVHITVTNAEAAYLNRYRISRDSTKPSMARAGTYLFGGHAAVIYMRIRKVGNEGDEGRTRRMRTVMATLTKQFADISLEQATALMDFVWKNTCVTNMTLADMIEAMGSAFLLRGVTPEGLQIPPPKAMEAILYAGMMTRQVDFEMSRAVLDEFLGQTFDVVDDD